MSTATDDAAPTDDAAASPQLETVSPARQPTRLASALALLAAIAGAWRLGASPLALGVAAVSVGVLAVGARLYRDDHRLPGALVALAGVLVAVGALGLTALAVSQSSGYLRLVPAVTGVLVLGAALVPFHGTGSRGLVTAGSGLLFLAVLVSGVFQSVALGPLLVAGTASVVAWDAGEHAVSVGEHLGRRSGTGEVEVAHVAGTVAVGVVGVTAAQLSGGVGLSGLSLASLALVLVAVLFFALALHE